MNTGVTDFSPRRYLGAFLVVAMFTLMAVAGYWRFGRAVEMPMVAVQKGTVAVQVIGPGMVQARVPVTLNARISATVSSMA